MTLLILFLAGVAGCICLIQRAPHIEDAEPSTLDTRDGLTEGQPACHSSGPRGGHVYADVAGLAWVCVHCSDSVPRKSDVPYDREVAEVVDAAERIARGAS